MTKSWLFKYLTCKIAENIAIAEEFWVTKHSAIAELYCTIYCNKWKLRVCQIFFSLFFLWFVKRKPFSLLGEKGQFQHPEAPVFCSFRTSEFVFGTFVLERNPYMSWNLEVRWLLSICPATGNISWHVPGMTLCVWWTLALVSWSEHLPLKASVCLVIGAVPALRQTQTMFPLARPTVTSTFGAPMMLHDLTQFCQSTQLLLFR